MKKFGFAAGILFGVVACQDASKPVQPAAQPQPRVLSVQQSDGGIPGQYIVVFKNDVLDVPGIARALATANGASLQFTYSKALKGFAGRMSDAAAIALAHNPNVAYVEQDQVATATTDQSMDANGDPWGLDRIDATSGLNGKYSYTLTGSGVTAYIIDTGIRTTHSEFGGRASGGYTAISDGNGTNDCNGHGTHVSGTVGGSTYGVAKAVTLVAVRVLDCGGSGTYSGVVAGVDWVTAHHAALAVANMSLGGGASSSLDQAVQNSIAFGVSYAIAAGNSGADACNYSPARAPNAMTIGATGKTDAKTSWSNYGDCVDWFAPGLYIKSAWNTSDGATNIISGTSMASPHTAGVAALYLQANPAATPQQVRDGLYAATTKGVVTSSNTANNHLLYTPPAGFGAVGPPPPPSSSTASFTKSCSGFTCSFNASGSTNATSYSWSFGDGSSGSGVTTSHRFVRNRTYTVTLTTQPGSSTASTSVTCTKKACS